MLPDGERGGGADRYEELRRQHLADMAAMSAGLGESIEWPADRLAAHRRSLLRALVTSACERSPWHRERLGGIAPDVLDDGGLDALPVMTKADLMGNFDDIVADRRLTREACERHLETLRGDGYLLDEYHVVASGGSTGVRGIVVYGWEAWAICFLSIVRFQLRDWRSDPALAGVPRIVAIVAASRASHISASIHRTFSGAGTDRHFLPVTEPLERIVAGLNELQPTILQGYSSALHALAVEARAGRLRIAPRRIIPTSEPLLPEARAELREAWDVPILNAYGMSEGVFSGCCGHGMHLSDDLCAVEPVDRDGNPVAPGVLSHHLYVTNLYNPTLPLIRYEVGDELMLLDGPCPCGSQLRRIADPQGRLDDTFRYGDLTVHPHVFRSALGGCRHVVEYQVRQTSRGATIAVRCDGAADLAALGTEVAGELARLGLESPAVTVTAVERIAREQSGKLRRFIPLASRQ